MSRDTAEANQDVNPPIILLTGASGFVGRHVAVALRALGWHVRAASRRPTRQPPCADLEWVHCDLEREETLAPALDGARAAVYLYHAVGVGRDYAERESTVARAFRRSADRAGISRIVYLGGVSPRGHSTRHLDSRRQTGELLRGGQGTTIELRTSMVIGHPSASFGLIRDLAVRMPWLVLPAWLDHDSSPIAICDVAAAIALGTLLPSEVSSWFDLPGPELLSHRALLEYLAEPLGTRILERRVNFVSPAAAALAMALVSRVRPQLSRELIQGLECDLRPNGPSFWDRLGVTNLRPLRQAIVDALNDERAESSPSEETARRITRKTLDWQQRVGVSVHG